MSLKKSDIAKNISSKASISVSSSKHLIDCFIDIIKSKSNNKDVKVASFGTFTNKVTPQRNGRNPKTGEAIFVPEKKKVSFKMSKHLKQEINKKN